MIDNAVGRAQVYWFLSGAFLYPSDENWTQDAPLLAPILKGQSGMPSDLIIEITGLDTLRVEYLRAFGAAGSPCYETEWGLPHEFRQSQEMADIAGFYHAFGFMMGGQVRERPDFLAAELEFMGALALKEAYAIQQGVAEHVEVCADAERKFLTDHLGRWIGLLAEYIRRTIGESPYQTLASFAEEFVKADAARLGAALDQPRLAEVRPTPPGPELSCGDCPIAGEQS
jgi:DMSO reductase family type II enzyme chaperone